jgi:hypothetical protein
MATTLAPSPAIALDGNEQRLNLFALGTDGSLYAIVQTQPSNGWSGWQSLGNPGTGLRDRPAAGLLNLIDLIALQVMAVADDFTIYRRDRNVSDDPWGPWQSLHGSSSDSVELTLTNFSINYSFTVDTSGTMQVSDGGAWTAQPGPVLAGTPAVGSSADGRLEVFAVGTDGQLYHQWQTAVGGGWSGWFSHGNSGAALAPSPAVGSSADGRLEVFAVGTDGQLYHIWQTAVNNGWSGWFSHGTP